jgi:hypothetical protein
VPIYHTLLCIAATLSLPHSLCELSNSVTVSHTTTQKLQLQDLLSGSNRSSAVSKNKPDLLQNFIKPRKNYSLHSPSRYRSLVQSQPPEQLDIKFIVLLHHKDWQPDSPTLNINLQLQTFTTAKDSRTDCP